MSERIYIVIGGGVVIQAYRGVNALVLSGQHSRCITGATVVPCDLLEALPVEIREDLQVEWDNDQDEDTPVIALDDIDDKR